MAIQFDVVTQIEADGEALNAKLGEIREELARLSRRHEQLSKVLDAHEGAISYNRGLLKTIKDREAQADSDVAPPPLP